MLKIFIISELYREFKLLFLFRPELIIQNLKNLYNAYYFLNILFFWMQKIHSNQ